MNKGIVTFEKYPAYKDSGVEWIGEIPEGWEVKPLKAIFAERREKNNPIKTKEILSLSMAKGVTLYSEKGRGGNKAKEDITAYKITYPDDIVLNSMNVIVGSVGLSKYFGAVSPVYYTLFLRNKIEYKIDYYDKIFQNKSFQMSLYRFGKGILIKKSEASQKLNTIRMKVPMNDLNAVLFPVPPLPEQTAIAKFLDDKCCKIDKAVAQKIKLIELLKERKQIIIQNAVTRGLDPDVKMKDSGVEWIGEIPEGWEVKRLASFGKFSKGGGFSKSDLQEEGERAVLYGDIYTKYNFIITDAVRFISKDTSKKSVEIKKGDLLFTGSGETIEDIGKCVVFLGNDITYAGGDVIIFKQSKYNSIFLSYTLNSETIKYEKAKMAKGEIIVHTYASKLRNIAVAIPPLKEQTTIVVHIEKESAKIDKAISLQLKQIEKLKEYKATLIDSAVTGKIKVGVRDESTIRKQN